MSTWIFKGWDQPVLDKEGKPTGEVIKRSVPRKSTYRVESLPGRRLVQEGHASKSIVADLEPGKYAVKVSKFSDTHEDDQSWSYEFFHDLTKEQWEHLRYIKPKVFKTMNTTDGPRLRCQFIGCDYEATSPTAAVIHEAGHWGVDLLSSTGPEMTELLQRKSGSYLADKKAAELQMKMTKE